MKKILIVTVLFVFFLAPSSFAASLTISNIPSTIEKDQEVNVDVSLTGAAANTQNYLRVAFYSDSSPTSYFGYTWNHENSWYNGTPSPIDPHKFLQISVASDGTWNGSLKTKIDTDSSFYKGTGVYKLKVGRYTASGTSVTDWSSGVEVALNAPSPSPSPTVSPTSTPLPTATKTPTSTKSPTPTKSHTPTKSPTTIKHATSTPTKLSQTKSVTPASSLSSSVSLISSPTISQSDTGKVLGVREEEPSATPKERVQNANVLGVTSKGFQTVLIFFGGTTLISACAILLFRKLMIRT